MSPIFNTPVTESCLVISIVSAAAPSKSRLIETVSQVHSNVLELVKHGVVNAAELMASAPYSDNHNDSCPSRQSGTQHTNSDLPLHRRPPLTAVSGSLSGDYRAPPVAAVSDFLPPNNRAHLSAESYDVPAHSKAPVTADSDTVLDSGVHLPSLLYEQPQHVDTALTSAPNKLSTDLTDSASPFTPRTQATYSMSSDEEQFSPPIYLKGERHEGEQLHVARYKH